MEPSIEVTSYEITAFCLWDFRGKLFVEFLFYFGAMTTMGGIRANKGHWGAFRLKRPRNNPSIDLFDIMQAREQGCSNHDTHSSSFEIW